MNTQDITSRIESVLERFGVASERREALKIELVRQFAQMQIEAAHHWVQLAESPALATLTTRDLKAKAKALGIPGYWNMSKAELVLALGHQTSGLPSK